MLWRENAVEEKVLLIKEAHARRFNRGGGKSCAPAPVRGGLIPRACGAQSLFRPAGRLAAGPPDGSFIGPAKVRSLRLEELPDARSHRFARRTSEEAAEERKRRDTNREEKLLVVAEGV